MSTKDTVSHTLFTSIFPWPYLYKTLKNFLPFLPYKNPFFFSKIIHELTQCYVYVGIGQLVLRVEGRAVRRGIKATCLQEGALG